MMRVLMVNMLAGAVMCQTPAGKPVFDIADVHVSPRSDWVKNPQHAMGGGYLTGDRYELRRATMLDLIRIAYNVDAGKVYGGPGWLDYDRFEIVARTKPGTRADTLRPMLQALLEDRFRLEAKMEARPAPAYLLTKRKSELKLNAAANSAVSGGCQTQRPAFDGGTLIQTIQCRNVTMEMFAQTLRPRLSNAARNVPVVNMTGLEGGWDVDLTIATSPAGPDGPAKDNLPEALEKLGLKVELGTAPQSVLVVERVNEQPTANPPGAAASLPPLPSPEFEVASLKPCSDTMTTGPRFEAGGRVTATCVPLISLIQQAWSLPLFEQPAGTPKWLSDGSRKNNISIVAKAPAGVAPDPAHNAEARDILNAMLRALLTDRYGMKVHFEERPVDAASLVAVKPKLTKADPAGRTGCARENQPPSSIVISRDTHLMVNLVCRDITMAQFAEQMMAYDPGIAYPVLDTTGIDGAWDFAINFDSMAGVMARFPLPAGPGAAADGQASEPSGALSFTDALARQLGLKLEMHKRPERVLVIDHIEEKPVEN
jgi:uncharacterized protein (TIGR03435 family)